MQLLRLVAITLLVISAAISQPPKIADIDSVTNGKVSGNQYSNAYFGRFASF